MFLWGKGRALGRRGRMEKRKDGEEGEVTVVEVADTEGEGEDTEGEGEVAGEEGEKVGVEGEITGVEEGVMFRDLGHAHRVAFRRVTLLYIM